LILHAYAWTTGTHAKPEYYVDTSTKQYNEIKLSQADQVILKFARE
jgi:hypothetical protein